MWQFYSQMTTFFFPPFQKNQKKRKSDQAEIKSHPTSHPTSNPPIPHHIPAPQSPYSKPRKSLAKSPLKNGKVSFRISSNKKPPDWILQNSNHRAPQRQTEPPPAEPIRQKNQRYIPTFSKIAKIVNPRNSISGLLYQPIIILRMMLKWASISRF